MAEKEVSNQSKSNPKKFWAHFNSKTKTRAGILDLEMKDNEGSSNFKTENDQEKRSAKLFYFCFYK